MDTPAQRDDFIGRVQARDLAKPGALEPRLRLTKFLRPVNRLRVAPNIQRNHFMIIHDATLTDEIGLRSFTPVHRRRPKMLSQYPNAAGLRAASHAASRTAG